MFFLTMALRNLFRNPRRTIICVSAIAFGLAAMIVYDGFAIGMNRNLVREAVGAFLGDAQIHREGFRRSKDVTRTIDRPNELLASLSRDSQVSGATARTFVHGMAASAQGSRPVLIVGIDAKTERGVSKIAESVVKGNYFSKVSPSPIETSAAVPILVGTKLASALDLKPGSRLVLTSSQLNGTLSQNLCRVAGVFDLHASGMNSGMVFIPLRIAQRLLGLTDSVHEIAIRLLDPSLARQPANPFWARYSQGGLQAEGWPKLVPELDAMLAISRESVSWVAVLLLILVGLGIMNTLLMAFFERIYELGVMKAVGTRPLRLMGMILSESAVLAALGVAAGIAVGLLIDGLLSIHGVRYQGAEVVGVSLGEPIFPVLRVKQLVLFSEWTVLFTVAAGVYPAMLAARIVPAVAMRRRRA